ncbi:MAG: sulfite reductase flavoprotein subunit alpha [Moraxellaceae bacterium]|nr:sulfite reductase flavoprotein subunit alpha [Moraxellaceae bacterium]
MSNIYIAYGSESGNARKLAETLQQQLAPFNPNFCELNEVNLNELTQDDFLLIITSSFGDGEPTGNATQFADNLYQDDLTLNCQFAVFGLGDVSYPKFCGFSIDIDEKLQELGAKPIAKRVDADTNFQPFFEQWSQAVVAFFTENSEQAKQQLQQLTLQVKSYSENQSFLAKLHSVQRIDKGKFPVYDMTIDITGSGMNYQAGDLLYVIPPVNQTTLQRIENFYSGLTDEQKSLLVNKELRLLTKPLLRNISKKHKNAELKALLKISASKQLADYIYGRDIADLLNDYYSAESLSVENLGELLSDKLPRAYSIASCGQQLPDKVRLCVREVAYQLADKSYVGSASHFLCHAEIGTKIPVYVRANAYFHLPTDKTVPIIMIGAGTGIAPYLGFLANKRVGESHLFFGERHRDSDFLYQNELENWLKNGHLTALHTAFSRDQAEKIYVQDVLLKEGETVWQLLEKGAEIFVCGSKANLAKPIDNVFKQIAQNYGNFSEDEAKQFIYDLVSEGRYHQDLY